MDIRTFRAATLQEALEQVRETLGPDAAVLHTRQVKRSRMGLFSSRLVEVEASVEMPAGNRSAKRAKATPSGNFDSEDLSVESTTLVANPAAVPYVEAEPEPVVAKQVPAEEAVEQDVEQDAIKSHMPSTSEPKSVPQKERRAKADSKSTQEGREGDASRLPPAMYEALSEMLDAGVEPSEAKSILTAATKTLGLEQLSDSLLLRGRICQFVSKSLNVADPIELLPGQQTVVALVGPTGVGKTTTLAKLATSFQLENRCDVGLITLDTLRPGAVDQLLQYAESLDAALEVVSSANQFLPALNRLKSCDVVFIDTAGRSPNDREQIEVLRDLLAAANPTSVQLIVSATSSIAHVQAAIDQFSSLNPTGLLITKLDEAFGFGAWLPILQYSEIPVSYVTHGQHVPRDLSVANRRRLASLLLGHANQPVS